jgi:hypothetical protein
LLTELDLKVPTNDLMHCKVGSALQMAKKKKGAIELRAILVSTSLVYASSIFNYEFKA